MTFFNFSQECVFAYSNTPSYSIAPVLAMENKQITRRFQDSEEESVDTQTKFQEYLNNLFEQFKLQAQGLKPAIIPDSATGST